MREEGGRITGFEARHCIGRLLGCAAGLGIVLLGMAASTQATFPGRNGKVAYAGRSSGSPSSDIFAVSANSSQQVNLTNSADAETDPAYSPDGERIAFSRPCGGPGGCAGGLFLMSPDGSGRVTVSEDGMDPAFSPDGARIVFFRRTREYDQWDMSTWLPFDIFVMNTDGSGQVQLTTMSTQLEDPSFSPDGSRIVFQMGTDIFVMNADGSSPLNLTHSPEREANPSFSPDGRKIAFERLMNPDPFARNTDIFVMNADGSGEVNLTNSPDIEGAPVFSPDGSKIAFIGDVTPGIGFSGDVLAMNRDGSERVNLSNTPSQDDFAPDWQPIPESCGKATATMVGTSARDILVGTREVDVIAGLDGNDVIKGRGRRDVICGGDGKDVLNGGKGKDKCDGAQGKDKAFKCEKKVDI